MCKNVQFRHHAVIVSLLTVSDVFLSLFLCPVKNQFLRVLMAANNLEVDSKSIQMLLDGKVKKW